MKQWAYSIKWIYKKQNITLWKSKPLLPVASLANTLIINNNKNKTYRPVPKNYIVNLSADNLISLQPLITITIITAIL